MTILTAIEEGDRSDEILEMAHELATVYDDTLVVLHVIPDDEYESHKKTIESIPDFENLSIDQEAESAKRVAEAYVESVLGDVDTDRIEARGRVGDISSEILDESESIDPRYLVIGGRRRSPTGKALFGDTAQAVLLNATCPVVSRLHDT